MKSKFLLEQLHEHHQTLVKNCRNIGVYITEVEQALGPVLQVRAYSGSKLKTCMSVLSCVQYLDGLMDGYDIALNYK